MALYVMNEKDENSTLGLQERIFLVSFFVIDIHYDILLKWTQHQRLFDNLGSSFVLTTGALNYCIFFESCYNIQYT